MKALRIRYTTKDGKQELSGTIPATMVTPELLEKYRVVYGDVEVVDQDEEY